MSEGRLRRTRGTAMRQRRPAPPTRDSRRRPLPAKHGHAARPRATREYQSDTSSKQRPRSSISPRSGAGSPRPPPVLLDNRSLHISCSYASSLASVPCVTVSARSSPARRTNSGPDSTRPSYARASATRLFRRAAALPVEVRTSPLECVLWTVRIPELALQERPEAVPQQTHRIADSFAVGNRHCCRLRRPYSTATPRRPNSVAIES